MRAGLYCQSLFLQYNGFFPTRRAEREVNKKPPDELGVAKCQIGISELPATCHQPFDDGSENDFHGKAHFATRHA